MSDPSSSESWHTIHRSVLPTVDLAERMPLYVRGGAVLSRSSVRVAASERVSFATYFGALPAGYWYAHTGVRSIRLSLSVSGAAEIEVRRTNSAGTVSTIRRLAAAEGRCTAEIALESGDGWVWCEAVGGAAGAVLDDIRWETTSRPRFSARLTVAVTTYNREDDCAKLLERLASDEHAMRFVDKVVVTDQGSRSVRGADRFPAASALLGEKLEVFEQVNLGGSGGFSRGMAAACSEGNTHVLLLDDDVDLEPESVCRLAVFAEHASRPMIVGAHMLSLAEPTRLHSFGERVDRRRMWWTPVEPSLSSIDLAHAAIDATPVLSRRIDVDFNGWWMCLVPVPLVRRHGASLPIFIKWDDAEFGLRASAAGVRTVTLPGAALWHMPWTSKDDGLDWQAYFQLRNRIVTALLHGGRGVLAASLSQDINHILCAQYGSVALRNLAILDVLSGVDHLVPVLVAGPARAGAVLRRYGQTVVPSEQVPPAEAPEAVARPSGSLATVLRAAHVLVRQVSRPRLNSAPVHLVRSQGKWWTLGLVDTAVVEAASGVGVFVFRRDRSTALRAIRRAIVGRCRLAWAWRRLSRSYRLAAPELASIESWQARFADVQAPARKTA